MVIKMKLVELQKFKEENPGKHYISWVKRSITVNGYVYAIRFVNVGGKSFPYVKVPEVKMAQPKRKIPLRKMELTEEEKRKVDMINDPLNKYDLRNCHYSFEDENGNEVTYFINGIGDKSIKAQKNGGENKYYWYNTKEGKFLLNKLSNIIGQERLSIEDIE